jgi:hypothetical protein
VNRSRTARPCPCITHSHLTSCGRPGDPGARVLKPGRTRRRERH